MPMNERHMRGEIVTREADTVEEVLLACAIKEKQEEESSKTNPKVRKPPATLEEVKERLRKAKAKYGIR